MSANKTIMLKTLNEVDIRIKGNGSVINNEQNTYHIVGYFTDVNICNKAIEWTHSLVYNKEIKPTQTNELHAPDLVHYINNREGLCMFVYGNPLINLGRWYNATT